jgi:hypothetical protein
MKKFICPDCNAELTEVNSIRTYVKHEAIDEKGKVSLISDAPLEYVSTDDYECPECFAVITSVIKD